jgi:peroxiredoxin
MGEIAKPGPAARGATRNKPAFYIILGALLALSTVAGVLVAFSTGAGDGKSSTILSGLPSDSSASDSPDSALAHAAHRVGFHSTADGTVGLIEKLPVESVHLSADPQLLRVGSSAPGFALQTPTGQTISLSDLKGKVVLIMFFATWSPSCQIEAQHIVAIRAASSVSKLALLAVNADGEDVASAYAFGEYYAIPYPVLVDPGDHAGSFTKKGSAGAVTKSYGVTVFPTFYLIGNNGLVTWRSEGEQPDALLLGLIAENIRR